MLLTNLSEPWVSHLLSKMISFLKNNCIYSWLCWLFTAAWAFLLLRRTGFGLADSLQLQLRVLHSMWGLPGPAIEPVSPAFFTPEPPKMTSEAPFASETLPQFPQL